MPWRHGRSGEKQTLSPLYPSYDLTAPLLVGMGVKEDFTATGPVRYGHRRTNDRDIYFVANRTDAPIKADCRFRVGRGSPQLWADVRFTLADKYEFMEPVNLAQARSGGGVKMSWNSVANAQGYFASAMGSKEGTEDVVFWSSSNSREIGDQLMTWLPPREVARLIKERVVLPASTTECVVPAQFVAAAPSAFLRFIAYGEEANFVHPPRPQDPKVDWNQEWAAKVRLKSTASALLGEEGMGGGASRGRSRSSGSSDTAQPEGGSAPQGGAPAVDPAQEGIKALKGLFGR